jgi:hypothetical protein
MEFAAAALSSIGSTISAGADALGTAISGTAGAFGAPAIPGLLGAAGTGSTAFSILSGGATVLSVLNAQRAGEMKVQSLNLQADDADTQSEIEGIQGTARRSSLKAQLTQAIGDRDVAAAASGVDLSFGTPSVARQQAIQSGERALEMDQDTQELRVSRLRERAAGLRAQAAGANAAGLGTAATLALEGGAKLFKRG